MVVVAVGVKVNVVVYVVVLLIVDALTVRVGVCSYGGTLICILA